MWWRRAVASKENLLGRVAFDIWRERRDRRGIRTGSSRPWCGAAGRCTHRIVCRITPIAVPPAERNERSKTNPCEIFPRSQKFQVSCKKNIRYFHEKYAGFEAAN